MNLNIDVKQGRALKAAAFLYMAMAVTAPIGLLYVPNQLIVPGDATATAVRIRASESLLRIGIGTELFHQTIAVFLVLALYRLFRPINENLAKLLVVLGALVSVPIMFVNVLNEIAALIMAKGADYLMVFEQPQRDALAYLFLRLHGTGIDITSIFWGLWLFPFGLLAIRSGFIPRILGVLLLIAGSAYLVSAFVTFLLPEYAAGIGEYAMILEIGEVPMLIWLFIAGLRPIPREGINN